MSRIHNLPFKAGDKVEAKSFEEGYRGSWFRGKVRKISEKNGSIGCVLEYINFPGEAKKWEKFYQEPPTIEGEMKDRQLELMVRPCYPPIYQKDQKNNSRKNCEVAVVVNNDWKVGDLVDWWTDKVYWCGELIQLLGHDKAKIHLLDPPMGEGETYDVQFKDLRPTLFWSPEQGWTVPFNQVPTVDGNRRCCALLIKAANQGEQTTIQGQKEARKPTSEFDVSLSSHASPPSHTMEHHPASPSQNQELDKCDSVEASHGKYDSVKLDDYDTTKHNESDKLKADDIREIKDEETSKGMNTKAEVNDCTERSDTIEASVSELEELLCKVKWLKLLLNHGPPMLNSLPSWKFQENRVTSVPKPDIITDMDG